MSVNLVYDNKNSQNNAFQRQNTSSNTLLNPGESLYENEQNVLSLIFQHALASTELTTPYPNYEFVQEIHQRCSLQTRERGIAGRWAVFQAPQPGAHPFVVSDCLFFDVGLKTVSFGDHVYHQYIAVSFA